MNSELLYQAVEMIEAEAQARPSGMEFEMAYQARVAIDRIKLAVKRSERPGSHLDQAREVGLLLLDALDRLQSVERRFQLRSRRTVQNPQENAPDPTRKRTSNGRPGIVDTPEPSSPARTGSFHTEG